MLEPTAFYSVPAFARVRRRAARGPARVLRRPGLAGTRAGGARRSRRARTRCGGTRSASPSRRRTPELVGRSVATSRRERGCPPFDVVCDLSLDDDLATRFSDHLRQRRSRRRLRLLMRSDGCIMGLSDAGAHVSQICDAVMPIDFLAELGPRPRASCRVERGRPQAHRRARRRARPRPGLPPCRRSRPTSSSSTTSACRPGRSAASSTCPPTASASLPTRRRASSTITVNGVPIRRDGAAVTLAGDERPGQILRS